MSCINHEYTMGRQGIDMLVDVQWLLRSDRISHGARYGRLLIGVPEQLLHSPDILCSAETNESRNCDGSSAA